jgi:multidrug efflux pump subunit AcrA (membrane-fusion protein)
MEQNRGNDERANLQQQFVCDRSRGRPHRHLDRAASLLWEGSSQEQLRCGRDGGVTKVARKSLQRQITLSSELVPFQEIDVYAKESGFVKNLYVDYGSRVKTGQLMATLEIPELEAQLQVDQSAIKNATDEVSRAEHELKRYQAQYRALHLEYTRLNGVFESQPGLVAQQEVDNTQGKDLAAAAQVDSAESSLEAAQSEVLVGKSRLIHDQALFAYARITAPFAGVITQRYANLGTLMQSGTSSSTQRH